MARKEMTSNQFAPLELNPHTQEPFLRLRKHKNIILTPMRWQDAPHMVAIFSDVRVYEWLASTPVPYVLKDAEDWLAKHKTRIDGYFQTLKDAQGTDSLITAEGAPVVTLREVNEDGSDTFLGNLRIARCFHGELLNTDTFDFDNAKKNVAENNALEVGDPKIVWSIGDHLAPSHHSQGIMSDALDTLLHEWAIPRMGVKHIIVGAFTGNIGSVRVFEKNGFKLIHTNEEHMVVRGKMRGMHILEWKLDGDL